MDEAAEMVAGELLGACSNRVRPYMLGTTGGLVPLVLVLAGLLGVFPGCPGFTCMAGWTSCRASKWVAYTIAGPIGGVVLPVLVLAGFPGVCPGCPRASCIARWVSLIVTVIGPIGRLFLRLVVMAGFPGSCPGSPRAACLAPWVFLLPGVARIVIPIGDLVVGVGASSVGWPLGAGRVLPRVPLDLWSAWLMWFTLVP